MKKLFLKTTSIYLLLNLLVLWFAPFSANALTSGPSQPEFGQFSPVSNVNMVDPFTGDFSYEIPLLDVGGYPIKLSYNAGVTMDQEASWVGLGWNINIGSINRTMRGIPDDFNGSDEITKEMNIKPNRTVGANFNVSAEFFGLSTDKVANVNMGLVYNSYRGIGFETGISIQSKSTRKNATLNLSYSTQSGFDASMARMVSETSKFETSLSMGINSRTGLKSIGLDINSTKNNYKLINLSSTTFAQASYFPSIGFPMSNYNLNLKYRMGGEVVPAIFPNGTIRGYHSVQKLKYKSKTVAAIGYMYLHQKENYPEDALLDYNRSNDEEFTPKKPYLPASSLTYDQFSFSAAQISGSFRLHRSDVGTVHDPKVHSDEIGANTGFEFGVAYGVKVGVNMGSNFVRSNVNKWNYGNTNLNQSLRFTGSVPGKALYEPAYFKANGEQTAARAGLRHKIMDEQAVRIQLKGTALNAKGGHAFARQSFTYGMHGDMFEVNRDKRAKTITYLSAGEAKKIDRYSDIPVYPLNSFYNVNEILQHSHQSRSNSIRKNHHISVFNILNTDGTSYVYGIPAYNRHWEETSFNVSGNTVVNSKLVYYDNEDASTGNKKGKDHYYAKTTMPPYAHTYLLTEILSANYVDVTRDGLTSDDIGDYVRFNYSQAHTDYGWRSPTAQGMNYYAAYDENLYSKDDDDKATYVYGQKEVWYLHSIETKNYVAVIKVSNRNDGYGVKDEKGEIELNKPLKKISSISLYSRYDLELNKQHATPIKTVYFNYDYSLCPNVNNNSGVTETVNGKNINQDKGKLTLQSVAFKYGNSFRSTLNPYKFEYNSFNPAYDRLAHDRWGNYKPDSTGSDPNNIEYPYTEQQKASQDMYAGAWNLSKIHLPSGGIISIDYEADDYAFVQNIPAAKMFKIAGVGRDNNYSNNNHLKPKNPENIYVYVKLDKALNYDSEFDNQYIKMMKHLYFKEYIDVTGDGDYEYIFGYGEILDVGVCPNDNSYGWIKLKNMPTGDWQSFNISLINPLTKYALIFAQKHLRDKIFPQATLDLEQDAVNLSRALVGMATDIASVSVGMNAALIANGFCKNINTNKSWVRLSDPDGFKIGGGHRVKRITSYDNWKAMSKSGADQFYAVEYRYTKINAQGNQISSGVASYEPIIGGDENSMHKPVFYKVMLNVLSKQSAYMEEPITESSYPSPIVGYSKVKARNIQRDKVKTTATGFILYQFHTAREFPTEVHATTLDMKRLHPMASAIINLLFHFEVDRTAVSQGYTTINNNMHGQSKSVFSYSEFDSINPVSGTEYFYHTPGSGIKALSQNGNIEEVIFGQDLDITVDARKETTIGGSHSLESNMDLFFYGYFPVVALTFWPEMSVVNKKFTSVVVNKTIQNTAILKKIRSWDMGSSVTTEHVLYDEETGQPLITTTYNEFNDPVSSINYPARWMYGTMRPAYQNIRSAGFIAVQNGSFNLPTNAAFFNGDEMLIQSLPDLQNNIPSVHNYVWITNKTSSQCDIRDKDGNNPTDGTYHFTIIRSGNRNLLHLSAQQTTVMGKPLSGSFLNSIDSIINCSAQTYRDSILQPCRFVEQQLCPSSNCTRNISCVDSSIFKNPYRWGIKGIWRPANSYAYSDQRTYSAPANPNQSNSRYDGLLKNNSLFWKYSSGQWDSSYDPNWIKANEVSSYSIFANEIENKDALGIFSSALYGYRHDLPVALAYNAQHREIFFDNMEEYGYQDLDNCHPQDRTYLHDLKKDSCLDSAYCIPSYQNLICDVGICHHNYINGVIFEGISNSFTGCSGPPDVFTYYSNDSAFVMKGSTYVITLVPSTDCAPYFGVWIDFNRDKDFVDPGEFVLSVPSSNLPTTDSITIPPWAYTGDTRMRVRSIKDKQPTASDYCSYQICGETEDYPIRISPSLPADTIVIEYEHCLNGFTTTEQAHSGAYSYVINISDSISFRFPVTSTVNCQNHFELTANKDYMISLWVRPSTVAGSPFDYQITANMKFGPGTNPSGAASTSGMIIEGWQRIQEQFTVPDSAEYMDLYFTQPIGGGAALLLDDIRIYPTDGKMISYVYSPNNLNYVAQLDENNYATFYEYDKENTLSRIKAETERGIYTVKESSSNLQKKGTWIPDKKKPNKYKP